MGLWLAMAAPRQHFLRRATGFAQCAQTKGVVALGETSAGFVTNEVAVEVRGCGKSQGPNQEKLTRGGLQQVGPANNLGDLHGGVIYDYSELICRNIVATPHHEISEVFPRYV